MLNTWNIIFRYLLRATSYKIPMINVIYIFIMVTLFVSCSWESKYFYVAQANMNIDIENMGDNLYRIYIYRSKETKDKNYFDLWYRMSEMPAITICVPIDDNKVYIIDDNSNLLPNVSEDFEMEILAPPHIENGELLTGNKWTEFQNYIKYRDSIDHIPSVVIRLDAYLKGLTIWDENNNQYQL